MADCVLFPGLAGVAIQFLLFGCCLIILLVKYSFEPRGRFFFDFLRDGSKQLAGAGWIHCLNIVFASGLGRALQSADTDACVYYFLNIVLDCTLGVAIEYWILQKLVALLVDRFPEISTGHYRDENGFFQVRYYVPQLALWIGVVTLMKVCILILIYVANKPLTAIAEAILDVVPVDNEERLIFVMVVAPLAMNALQFVLTDMFLKGRRHATLDTPLAGGAPRERDSTLHS